MNRRAFLSFLAGLPIVGRWFQPKRDPSLPYFAKNGTVSAGLPDIPEDTAFYITGIDTYGNLTQFETKTPVMIVDEYWDPRVFHADLAFKEVDRRLRDQGH